MDLTKHYEISGEKGPELFKEREKKEKKNIKARLFFQALSTGPTPFPYPHHLHVIDSFFLYAGNNLSLDVFCQDDREEDISRNRLFYFFLLFLIRVVMHSAARMQSFFFYFHQTII